MSGLTPVERDGLLDFTIERPNGLDGWALLLTVRGRGLLLDRPGETVLQEGDVLLVPPRAEHHYRRHGDSPSWWHRWVYFQPRQTWLPWLSWRGGGPRATLLRGQDDDFRHELDRIFSEIDAWSINADAFATEMSFNLLERAILICSRYNEKPVADYDPRLAGVCSYIAENIEKPLTLDVIADHARLSVSRLAHLFQDRYGCSVMAWRDDLRMQLACRILRMTDAPVKQVAIRVGYANPLHFSKMFRKRMGLSPSGYREGKSEAAAT
jgi:AraC family transcriptional regulator of arabinose operon